MNRLLDPTKTIDTIDTLERRISERFPTGGLASVCSELHKIAEESRRRCQRIARPNQVLRLGVAALIAVSVVALFYSLSLLDISWKTIDAAELLTVSEAAMNNLVLIGAAIYFLVSSETRVKRKRALAALDELRAIAHVIDMHQLTKGPGANKHPGEATASSPKRDMSSFQLTRYLDYCSEMLSLTGKVAALYAQHFRDEVVLTAVNELESLTTGLSRKIWQKIMIMHKLEDQIEDT
jgi:hypothetical protein